VRGRSLSRGGFGRHALQGEFPWRELHQAAPLGIFAHRREQIAGGRKRSGQDGIKHVEAMEELFHAAVATSIRTLPAPKDLESSPVSSSRFTGMRILHSAAHAKGIAGLCGR